MRLIDADKLKGEGYRLCRYNSAMNLDIITLDVIPTAFDPKELLDLADRVGGMAGAYIRKEVQKVGEDDG